MEYSATRKAQHLLDASTLLLAELLDGARRAQADRRRVRNRRVHDTVRRGGRLDLAHAQRFLAAAEPIEQFGERLAQFIGVRVEAQAIGKVLRRALQVTEYLHAPGAGIRRTDLRRVDRERASIVLERVHDASLLARDITQSGIRGERL